LSSRRSFVEEIPQLLRKRTGSTVLI